MPARLRASSLLLVLGVTVACTGSLNPVYACDLDDPGRCDGAVSERCLSAGDIIAGSRLERVVCTGGRCAIDPTTRHPFCTLGTERDPRCAGATSICIDAANIGTCTDGYLVADEGGSGPRTSPCSSCEDSVCRHDASENDAGKDSGKRPVSTTDSGADD